MLDVVAATEDIRRRLAGRGDDEPSPSCSSSPSTSIKTFSGSSPHWFPLSSGSNLLIYLSQAGCAIAVVRAGKRVVFLALGSILFNTTANIGFRFIFFAASFSKSSIYIRERQENHGYFCLFVFVQRRACDVAVWFYEESLEVLPHDLCAFICEPRIPLRRISRNAEYISRRCCGGWKRNRLCLGLAGDMY